MQGVRVCHRAGAAVSERRRALRRDDLRCLGGTREDARRAARSTDAQRRAL